MYLYTHKILNLKEKVCYAVYFAKLPKIQNLRHVMTIFDYEYK